MGDGDGEEKKGGLMVIIRGWLGRGFRGWDGDIDICIFSVEGCCFYIYWGQERKGGRDTMKICAKDESTTRNANTSGKTTMWPNDRY